MGKAVSKEAYEEKTKNDMRVKVEDRAFAMFYPDSKVVNDLVNHISENAYNVDVCDVTKTFDMKYVLGHDSAGNARLVFATMIYAQQKKSSVAIKVFMPPSEESYDNSGTIESLVYSKILSKLLEHRNSPNLLAYIGNAVCKDVAKKLMDTLEKNQSLAIANGLRNFLMRVEMNKSMYDKYYQPPKTVSDLHLLVLEDAQHTITWEKWIQLESKSNEWYFKALVFEILYTAECFNRCGLRHNDLHMENILIQRVSEEDIVPFCFEYIVGKKSFYLPVKWLVIIIDFDRAYAQGLPDNKYLKVDCRTFGRCNEPNDKYDTFRVLADLGTYKDQARVHNIEKKLCQDAFSRELWVEHTGEFNFLKSHDGINTNFVPPNKPDEKWMLKTIEILQHSYFDDLSTLPQGYKVLETYRLPDATNNNKKRNIEDL